jgi:hypothetical protein
VRRQIAVADVRADGDAAVVAEGDVGEVQPTDVDQQIRFCHTEFHVVHQVRTAREVGRVGMPGQCRHGIGRAGGDVVVEGLHRLAAFSIAETMLG